MPDLTTYTPSEQIAYLRGKRDGEAGVTAVECPYWSDNLKLAWFVGLRAGAAKYEKEHATNGQ